MTDTFTVCALRTQPADARMEDSDLIVFAAGATRFTFYNGRWASADSSWLCGGHGDPEADALQWIAEALGAQPLVTWSIADFARQVNALAMQADLADPTDVTGRLRVIRDAVRRSVIPSVDVHFRDADGVESAVCDDVDLAEVVALMRGDTNRDPLAMHRAITAETELVGRLAIAALGRGAELDRD
ncbi:MAG: hypothetical protein DI637_01630 [Citromicrobium sp.]|nr:MAG: hypothetical protein DI637_01630 [Citromicrobium sp.]